MTSRKKYKIIKSIFMCIIPLYFVGINALGVFFDIDKIWENMFDNGITRIIQWITLIVYRFMIYIFPAIIVAFIHYDRRLKYCTRLIIWLNILLFEYLFANVIINVFAINLIVKIEIFKSLDVVVALSAYVFTYIKKRKIELDSSGTIINEKP